MPFEGNQAQSLSRSEIKFFLNRLNAMAHKTRLGDLLDNAYFQAVGIYDFSVVGGAVGLISLRDSEGQTFKLPTNAIIKNVVLDVVTEIAGGAGSTFGLQLQSANDLLADTAIASVTGRVQGIPNNAVANMIKLTAERTLQAEIGTDALTAGKVNIFIEYMVSE